jgi:hypothetical protein
MHAFCSVFENFVKDGNRSTQVDFPELPLGKKEAETRDSNILRKEEYSLESVGREESGYSAETCIVAEHAPVQDSIRRLNLKMPPRSQACSPYHKSLAVNPQSSLQNCSMHIRDLPKDSLTIRDEPILESGRVGDISIRVRSNSRASKFSTKSLVEKEILQASKRETSQRHNSDVKSWEERWNAHDRRTLVTERHARTGGGLSPRRNTNRPQSGCVSIRVRKSSAAHPAAAGAGATAGSAATWSSRISRSSSVIQRAVALGKGALRDAVRETTADAAPRLLVVRRCDTWASCGAHREEAAASNMVDGMACKEDTAKANLRRPALLSGRSAQAAAVAAGQPGCNGAGAGAGGGVDPGAGPARRATGGDGGRHGRAAWRGEAETRRRGDWPGGAGRPGAGLSARQERAADGRDGAGGGAGGGGSFSWRVQGARICDGGRRTSQCETAQARAWLVLVGAGDVGRLTRGTSGWADPRHLRLG